MNNLNFMRWGKSKLEGAMMYAQAHGLALAATVYFSISALLSISILLRLLFLPIESVKYANGFLYYLNYYVMNLTGGILLLSSLLSDCPKLKRKNFEQNTSSCS